jgi:hypothetical protein
MKTVLPILLFITLVNNCWTQDGFSKDSIDLETKVIEQLKLNRNRIATELITFKELSNHFNETVFLIPEIENEIAEDEELYYELTSHVLIVNSITGEIKYHYIETSETNGWISDAIMLVEINIDTTTYKLSESDVAFGVKVNFRSSSQPNPNSYTILSLYIKRGDSLKKILDKLVVYEYSGVVNVNPNICDANIITEKNELTVLESKTNGYYNIQLKNTLSNTIFEANSEGDCDGVEKSSVQKMSILKFDNTEYE